MPKLIVQRRKGAKRKKPMCGRVIETFEPHSPFQILLDKRIKAFGLSVREVARRLSEYVHTGQSTLWMWLHNKNGYPSPKSLKPKHIEAFSKVLKVPAQQIKDAIDASRPMFRPGQLPAPAPSMDGLQSLIEILTNDKRQFISKSFVLNLAKNLHNGITLSQKAQRE